MPATLIIICILAGPIRYKVEDGLQRATEASPARDGVIPSASPVDVIIPPLDKGTLNACPDIPSKPIPSAIALSLPIGCTFLIALKAMDSAKPLSASPLKLIISRPLTEETHLLSLDGMF